MSEILMQTLHSLKNGRYIVTLHAQRRMAERKISHADIRNCGKTGRALFFEDKIKVFGRDCDGENTTIICVKEDDVLIITIF